MKVRCVKEPRGDAGLEGYQLDEVYEAAYIPASASFRPYYRIWPTSWEYYETCSPQTFKRYFQEVQ